jgi:hypothetical protein
MHDCLCLWHLVILGRLTCPKQDYCPDQGCRVWSWDYCGKTFSVRFVLCRFCWKIQKILETYFTMDAATFYQALAHRCGVNQALMRNSIIQQGYDNKEEVFTHFLANNRTVADFVKTINKLPPAQDGDKWSFFHLHPF